MVLSPCLVLAALSAHAAGYHLLEVDAIYGTAEQRAGESGEPPVEAGFGLYPIADQFGFWMTFGDPDRPGDGHGHRVKEWWLEGGWYGYQLGDPPEDIDEDPDLAHPFLVPVTWGRIGTDQTTRRRFSLDQSHHLALSVPGFWRVQPRRAHFGPTAGLGFNLTWWDRWKGFAGEVINTGKVTGEAGWFAGATWRDSLYAQGRATAHYDLFGIHQVNLGLAGVAGAFLGRFGSPFGLQVKGELDRGNDTVTTRHRLAWAVRAALFVRAPLPRDRELEELEEVLDALRRDGLPEGP